MPKRKLVRTARMRVLMMAMIIVLSTAQNSSHYLLVDRADTAHSSNVRDNIICV